MAKLTYKLPVLDYSADFMGDFDLEVANNGKSATWENEETGAKVVVTGTKLVDADEGDHFESGSITGFKVYNGNEKLLLDVSGLQLKAAKLTAAFEDDDIFAALNLVIAGNDKVIGTKKSEFLFSGAGNDVLTGKGGSDTFSFQSNSLDEIEKKSKERDVITDFETAKGKERDFLDLGDLEIAKVSYINKKQDTQLTFDDGSVLVLEDVSKKEWTSYANSVDL